MDVDPVEPSPMLPGSDPTQASEESLRNAAQFLYQHRIAFDPFVGDIRDVIQPYAIGNVRLEFLDQHQYGFFSTKGLRQFIKIGSLYDPIDQQVIALRPFLHEEYASFLADWGQLVAKALLA